MTWFIFLCCYTSEDGRGPFHGVLLSGLIDEIPGQGALVQW